MRWILLAICFFVAPWVTFGTPVLLNSSASAYPLGLRLQILEDPKGNLGFKEVQSRVEAFKPSDQATPNFGFTSSAYWAYVDLSNQDPERSEWLLEFGYPLIDRLSLYIPNQQGVYVERKAGDLLPFDSREVKHHNFLFRFDLAEGQSKRIFLRVQSASSLQIPLTLWEASEFSEVVYRQTYEFGLYYGILLAMMLYNLFIFLSIRDRNYLFYVLFIGFFVGLQMSLNGLAYQYLWPQSPFLANKGIPVFLVAALLFSSLFTRGYLLLNQRHQRLNRIMAWFEGLLLVVTLANLFLDYRIAIKISTLMALPAMGFILSAGAISARKGYRPAYYFLLAWSALIGGATLMALKSFGVLPSMFLTDYGMQIGAAMEVLLLSLGLADKINVMRKEKYLAERAAGEEAKRRFDELQKLVAEVEAKASQVAQASQSLSSSTEQIAQGAGRMAENLSQEQKALEATNQAIAEMVERNQEITAQVNQGFEAAQGAMSNAEAGNAAIMRTTESMARIEEASKKIQGITKVITGIASQTNLLSLNAAIEAAKAGEFGKGFSVVAQEVRDLAGRSNQAVSQINQLIEQSVDRVNDGNQVIQDTSEQLQSIITQVEALSSLTQEIQAAVVQQNQRIEQIAGANVQIGQGSRSNAQGAHEFVATTAEISSTAQSLNQVADDLRATMQRIKLGQGAA
ncbi:MAG: 7TM diverse intracellular signaling domain-containing protein [bacterium]|nr:7TM diverse intracellular signaling domain-containing protein [bacterium]